MMNFSNHHYDTYKPHFLLKNAHINTIYPYFFRKSSIIFTERKRYPTPDGDFYDVDFHKCNTNKLAILLHGMEGSSYSQYILALSNVLSKKGWDIAAINHRSCSGSLNNLPSFYHSGYYCDLDHLLKLEEDNYDIITIVGFSLGGNITLNYLGNCKLIKSPKIKAAVAVSVPVHLSSACVELDKPKNKIYAINFLKTLKNKVKDKHKMFPRDIDIQALKRIKTLRDFDNAYTAPLHGFNNAEDYYQKVSSIYLLHCINTPTLIINALDDPFLSKECYPLTIAKKNPSLELLLPKYGGHVGFTQFNSNVYWSDRVISDFLEKHTSRQI